MVSMHLDNIMENVADESDQQLLSPCSADLEDIFGDLEVRPRVGHQYQAEIPPLMVEYDFVQVVNEPNDLEIMVNLPNCFSLGLPIPVMWANDEIEKINGIEEFENSEESQITSNDECAEPRVESLGTVLDNGKDMAHSDLQSTTGSDQMDVALFFSQESKNKSDHVQRGLCPLPGSSGESWGQVERESFLLGLYIFGKNLNLVKRFVESKEMGDILSFYYGKFYKSDGYRRWSECRKLKSKRFVHGQKIFTGWRQQELLSRHFSHVSEECKVMLMEVSRKFGEGTVSFEDYVFSLKNTVGVNMLVEAVGVGKGKQDLTGTAMEPVKTANMLSVHSEIPVGKACSSLKSSDIIRFLTGDFRLSKARSNDLFWEAVWPRLLARGWHSEQPKDGFSGSKNSLVFVIPGVKKFSRRKFVKGKHYFYSISDVLNKVASEPGLLDLETEAAEVSQHKEEDKLDYPIKQCSDDLPNKRQHCYLQPRKSNYTRHLMQFTIVDTSSFQGEGRPKVRELRSLPVETTNISAPSNSSSESEEDDSEDEEDDHDEEEETNTPNIADDMNDRAVCADSSDCANSVLNNSMPNTPTSTSVAVEKHENHSTSPPEEKQEQKSTKYQLCEKAKSGHAESSCSIENISVDQKLEENGCHCRSSSNDACDMIFQLGPPQNLSPASSLAKGSSDRCNEGNASENCLDREVSPEKHEDHTFIDLNEPQVSSEFGNDEPITDMVQNYESVSENKSSVLTETSLQVEQLNLADGMGSIDQQPMMTNRRQSTRNRPLTTKALEALAFGYLSPKRKRRDTEAPQHNPMSKAPRRIHGKTDVNGTLRNGNQNNAADSRIDEQILDALGGNTSIVGDSRSNG